MRNMTRWSALALVCVTVALGACDRSSPPGSTTVTTPPATPPAAAPASSSGVRLYASDETGGNVVVIDPEFRLECDRLDVFMKNQQVFIKYLSVFVRNQQVWMKNLYRPEKT